MPSYAKKIFFGTAGIPRSTKESSTEAGIDRINELGLDSLEIEFVRGVKMSADTAFAVKKRAKEKNIRLSVHAPYFINLNSQEEGKRLASQERILRSARIGHLCGAESVIFHPGFYGRNPEEAYLKIKKSLQEIRSILKSENNPIILRPETMGKKTQFGSLTEIINLCLEIENVQPCIDFSHLHARDGRWNSYEEFYKIIRKIERSLGKDAIKNVHIHISGIDYTEKGEKVHLNLKESDFRYDEWIQVLKDCSVEGIVICESPNLELDALMLKRLYYEGEK
ncbi:TIM barrel protein [Candidatus Aminicenantes bacterium AC-335-B20]|jgi:deoxyribonuclease-4|nr:TIM barrel protein [SCandidatus Aminicenantes bacterium Aminicenantia_JdfR_composite]MCP2597118.1 TIM barrel protein [Candidatus Aminicenantes bacterium AC-335-G13]MCP2598243.1 TIM barrel protein [Candidatus Aminicenantes bacterium AC-335-L06]MCP2598875.1 TIM barrel protein [Candidatus Aminicenantes bacterium AC-335-B20]MCP2618673.1 TIM barrel protein [Candidatus Aminicenantes bacterium AC-335-A11]